MIRITDDLLLNENDIHYDFVRSSGPGGQNVNKLSTAVQLRFDVKNNHSLPVEVRQRLMVLAARQISREGILIIHAQRFRFQERNRQDALKRLIQLIIKASIKPKRRIKTNPSKSSKEKRLFNKQRQSQKKSLRKKDWDYF